MFLAMIPIALCSGALWRIALAPNSHSALGVDISPQLSGFTCLNLGVGFGLPPGFATLFSGCLIFLGSWRGPSGTPSQGSVVPHAGAPAVTLVGALSTLPGFGFRSSPADLQFHPSDVRGDACFINEYWVFDSLCWFVCSILSRVVGSS